MGTASVQSGHGRDADMLRVYHADDTEFGFSASIWGHDMQRCQNIADKLYNGMGKRCIAYAIPWARNCY